MRLPTLACALALVSCTTETPVTEIIVVVDSDLMIPVELDAIRITVERLGPETQTASARLTGTAGLPVTTTLVHRGGPLGPITVTATGTAPGTPGLDRTAQVSFIQDESRVLRLDLVSECAGRTCGSAQTCAPGGCRSVNVSASELEAWNGRAPRLGDGGTGDDAGFDAGSMDSGTSDAGMEPDAGRIDAGADAGITGRVTSGLVVLYEFDEGSGAAVADTSGVGAAMNLTIQDTGATSWIPGALSIDSNTAVWTAGSGTKVIDACTASDEVTIEVWVVPANDTQSGPARVVTLSQDTSERDFTLGQSGSRWSARLRTTDSSLNGQPDSLASTDSVTTSLTHVVFTRSDVGNAQFFLDGAVDDASTRTGDFSGWDASHTFALANEITLDRTWLGEIHLVAVYDRALTPAEVMQNFLAGP